MNTVALNLFVFLCLLGQVVGTAKTCQCSDYGEKLGCTNWAQGCYWINEACVRIIPDCASQNMNDCGAPGCFWNVTDPVGTCSTFTQCNQIDDSNALNCKQYGCIPDDNEVEFGTCKSYTKCSSIKSQPLCDKLTNYLNNTNEMCAWDTGIIANTTASCVAVTKCKKLSQDVCSSKPYCTFSNNKCSDAKCEGLDQAQCGSHKSLCVWIGIINTKESATDPLGKCLQNDCSRYGSGNCNQDGNYNFCAWDGLACTQCYDSRSAFLQFAVMMSLFFVSLF